MSNPLKDRYAKSGGHYRNKTEKTGNTKPYFILISVLVAIGVGVTAWFTFANPQTYIEHHVISFEPLNEHQLRLKFQVGLPTDQSTICGIEALSAQKAVVGYKEIEVLPSSNYLRSFEEIIETVEPAVTGLISYCFTE